MKRWLICAAAVAAAAALGGLPFTGTDVAQLQPVEALYFAQTGGRLHLTADTGAEGWGATAAAALQDMQAHCAGAVFLDTAAYVLVEPQALNILPEAAAFLRPSCRVCLGEGTVDLEEAAAYLAVHTPGVTFQDYLISGAALPVLYVQEGRMLLAQP